MRVPVSVIAQNGKGFIVGEAIKYAGQKIQFIDVNVEALGNYYLYTLLNTRDEIVGVKLHEVPIENYETDTLNEYLTRF
jgi:hypothetical protein